MIGNASTLKKNRTFIADGRNSDGVGMISLTIVNGVDVVEEGVACLEISVGRHLSPSNINT
jgi:hypothetical protein